MEVVLLHHHVVKGWEDRLEAEPHHVENIPESEVKGAVFIVQRTRTMGTVVARGTHWLQLEVGIDEIRSVLDGISIAILCDLHGRIF